MMGVPAPRELAPLIAGFRRLMPNASPSDVYFVIATEMGMGRNARMVADNRVETGTAPVYRYVVNWRTSANGGKFLSPHGVEMPMVFDTANQPFGTIENNQADYQRMADVVSPMWAQFARTGNPTRPGLPEWPQYRIGERSMMVIDNASAARIDPLGPEQALIAAYF
jgi:para-nitrobenzyl esterase